MIRIGILGCAEIAFRRFLPALMENKEFECVCIAEEYDKSKLEQFEKEFGIKSAENFQAIIEDENIDAVYIPLPPALHFPYAKAALEHGKHVFVEKHIFADGTERQFDPDYDMSESFRRILEGKNIKPHDITMLRHENLELNLMKKYNMVHEDAHSLAEQKYNYKKELDEFLERIGG